MAGKLKCVLCGRHLSILPRPLTITCADKGKYVIRHVIERGCPVDNILIYTADGEPVSSRCTAT